MPTRVGIVGCGHVCAYARAFSDLPDTTVVALAVPPSDARRMTVAQHYSISHIYDTVTNMLAKEALDIVVVGSPPSLHAAHCKEALEAGAHVLCEKPPCLTYVEASAAYFRSLYVDRHLEYALCCRAARGLPPPRPHLSAIHVRWLRRTAPRTPWAKDVAIAGGGVLADFCHAPDIALYAFGDLPVERAQGSMYDASGKTITEGAEDAFGGTLTLAGGRTITLDISWAADHDEQTLIAYGTAPAAPPHGSPIEDSIPIVADEDIYHRTAQQFIRHCYSSNRAKQLDVTMRGVRLQRVLDALYQSARTSTPVTLG